MLPPVSNSSPRFASVIRVGKVSLDTVPTVDKHQRLWSATSLANVLNRKGEYASPRPGSSEQKIQHDVQNFFENHYDYFESDRKGQAQVEVFWNDYHHDVFLVTGPDLVETRKQTPHKILPDDIADRALGNELVISVLHDDPQAGFPYEISSLNLTWITPAERLKRELSHLAPKK